MMITKNSVISNVKIKNCDYAHIAWRDREKERERESGSGDIKL